MWRFPPWIQIPMVRCWTGWKLWPGTKGNFSNRSGGKLLAFSLS